MTDQLLGGRLALLAPDELSTEQRRLHDRLTSTRVSRATSTGYRAALPDGRLIGPFNAFLRAPAIAEQQLAWAQAISAADLPGGVREVVVLTVAAEWNAEYATYAHRIAARGAGVPEASITALTDRRPPPGLEPDELLAHRLALALVRDHDVPDPLYAEVVETFGEHRTVVLLALIGQYLATSALLTCFRVSAPR